MTPLPLFRAFWPQRVGQKVKIPGRTAPPGHNDDDDDGDDDDAHDDDDNVNDDDDTFIVNLKCFDTSSCSFPSV